MMQCEAGLDVVRDQGSLKSARPPNISQLALNWNAVKNTTDFSELFVSMNLDPSEC